MSDIQSFTPTEDPVALRRWQERLLLFMAASLVALALVFFVASLWHYGKLQQYFDPPPLDVGQEIKRIDSAASQPASAEYRDWYVRALLEEFALKRRHQQNSVALQSRIWTRLIGFLTGMALVFSGCVFILGKLREHVNLSADLPGAKWALVSTSPGLALAVCGTAVIALSIYVPAKVDSTDASVYLPTFAVAPSSQPPLASPASMAPPQTASGTSPAKQPVPNPPPLPSEVENALREEAAKDNHPSVK